MNDLIALQPADVWNFFALICSIPHPSGHERALTEALRDAARDAGLAARMDAAGNLRIDRPAAPGLEAAPTVILQGHLDMVPESDHPFDFLTEPINPRVDGDWVRADGTTLGGDNGIGAAHIMALLCDPELRCGPLAGVFTVEEETGMGGAARIAPEFLAGDFLLNCDHDNGEGFCIGCAGGARQTFTFAPKWESAAGNGVLVTLTGLPGGHSGNCIHLDRGNAIRFLAEFLDLHPELRLAALDAGRVDNAIPSEAVARAVTPAPPSELQRAADAFALLVKKECANAGDMRLAVTPAPPPDAVWDEDSRRRIVSALALAPDGVIVWSEEFGVPRDSSNLAVVRTAEGKVTVSTSQRSLEDAARDRVCALIAEHFRLFGAEARKGHVYPATTPGPQSRLRQLARRIWAEMGHPDQVTVVHAGLETGWFSLKNSALEIVSCGPHIEEYHTPRERVSIASVAEFDRFLRRLLREIPLQL
ncbi:MAG: beta-Ala-His dipeptidase [Lentisphaeria bacterium]|nr:beta-Ala-His dipeptidase [Lentisphaeria bacterium]